MNKIETYKGVLNDPDKIYRRLKYMFDSASKEDLAAGLTWYETAHAIAAGKAIKYGFDVSTVCAVISALSPAVSWERNLIDADTLLKAVARGETDPTRIPVSTYGPQAEKAVRIAWSNQPDHIGNGLKTVSFYLNILGIQDRSVCTIDRHMLGAAVGSRSTQHQDIALTHKRYFSISNGIKRLARNRGLMPKQCQAVVWLAYRTKLGYKNEAMQ